MIITMLLNFLVLSAICVGCDHVMTPVISRCQASISRTDVAWILCLVIAVIAFLARGVAGLLDVSLLGLIGPAYVNLTGTTMGPISMKELTCQSWEILKQAVKRLFGIK